MRIEVEEILDFFTKDHDQENQLNGVIPLYKKNIMYNYSTYDVNMGFFSKS